ncbi:hypothetical protein AC630_29100 [Bradyrhizobium sp. AS23.2]|nr:hypothetical protein AC630_29100 [Bradyrhizobium sp. AS23.2]
MKCATGPSRLQREPPIAVAPAPAMGNHAACGGRAMVLRVVSEQSEADIKKQRAHDQLSRDLRRFAANFLRLTSGSGKALELLPQLEKLSASIKAYADAYDGALPSQKTVHQILDSRAALIEYRPWIKDVDEASRRRWEADGTYARNDAVAGIIKAGLRMVASELVDQLTQHSAAEDLFYEQIRRLEDVREKSRRQNNPKK